MIPAPDGRSGPDDARAARDHDALPVGRVVRHGHGREDRAGEIAIELVHEDGLKKRPFIDPLPPWGGVGRSNDRGPQGITTRDGGPIRRPKG